MSGHKPQHGENNPPPKPKQGGGEDKSTNRHVYVEPGVQIDFVQDLKKKYDSAQNESKTQYENQLFWTKVAAGLLLLTAGFAGWQGHSTKKAADAALEGVKDSESFFALEHRPYMVALDPVFIDNKQLLVNATAKARLTVKNIGKTPAFKQRGTGRIRLLSLVPNQQIAESDFNRKIDELFAELTKMANDLDSHPSTIPFVDVAPEQPSYETRELESGLSVDDAKRVSQGATLIIFFGLLRYNGMGTSYETQFCWYYSGGDSDSRTGLQTWTLCSVHNTIR